MVKKSVLFLIVLVGMIALNTGFFNKKSDLNVVKAPSVVAIMGNQHELQIAQLHDKITKLQQKSGTDKDIEAINQVLQQIAALDTVQTNDAQFITKLMAVFKNKKAVIDNGYIMRPKSGALYSFQFGYNVNLPQQSTEDMVNNLKQGYIPNFYLFPNNMLLMPLYDKDQDSSISTAEIRLDDNTVKYFVDFYNAQMKAKQK